MTKKGYGLGPLPAAQDILEEILNNYLKSIPAHWKGARL